MPEQKGTPQPVKLPENPKLKEAMSVFRGESNNQNLNVVINELVRARLIVPVAFDFGGQMPKSDGKGKILMPKDTRISYQMVTTQEGQKFFIAFSDEPSLRQWKDAKGKQLLFLGFNEVCALVERNEMASGLVVNPMSDNMRFPKQILSNVKKQKDAFEAGRVPMQIKPGDNVTIVEPTILPDELLNPICDVLKEHESIAAAYFQIMILNNDSKSYLIVLDGPKDDKLFDAVAAAARPYLQKQEKKLNLNLTTSAAPLGQQGMRASEPFYRKGEGRVLEEDDDE